MAVLTNLIHAALLAATALLVHSTGSVVWMYFIRNVTLFFALIGILYISVVIAVIANAADASKVLLLLVLVIIPFTMCAALGFVSYDSIARTLQRHAMAEARRPFAATILHYGAVVIQTTLLGYYLCTAVQYYFLFLQEEDAASNDSDSTITTDNESSR